MGAADDARLSVQRVPARSDNPPAVASIDPAARSAPDPRVLPEQDQSILDSNMKSLRSYMLSKERIRAKTRRRGAWPATFLLGVLVGQSEFDLQSLIHVLPFV